MDQTQHLMSYTVPSHHLATSNGSYIPANQEPRYNLVQDPAEQIFRNGQKLPPEIATAPLRLNPAGHMAHTRSYESPVDLSNNKHLSSSRLVKEEVGQGHSSAHSSRHHGYLQPGHSMATPVSVGIPENEHGNYQFLGLFLKTVRFGSKRVILIKVCLKFCEKYIIKMTRVLYFPFATYVETLIFGRIAKQFRLIFEIVKFQS